MGTGRLFVLILCYQENYSSFTFLPSPSSQLSVLSQNTINVEVITVELFSTQYMTLDMVKAVVQNLVSVEETS